MEGSNTICQSCLPSGGRIFTERTVPHLRLLVPIAQDDISWSLCHRQHVVDINPRRFIPRTQSPEAGRQRGSQSHRASPLFRF